MMGARQKPDFRVGLEVANRVIDILSEGETWLARTGGIGGLSGSDIRAQWPHRGRGLGRGVSADGHTEPLLQGQVNDQSLV